MFDFQNNGRTGILDLVHLWKHMLLREDIGYFYQKENVTNLEEECKDVHTSLIWLRISSPFMHLFTLDLLFEFEAKEMWVCNYHQRQEKFWRCF